MQLPTTSRSPGALWLGEVVATFGLALVIFGVVTSGRRTAAPFAVGAYAVAALLFTSSTSFANPAVTLGRTLSDTFTGITPASVAPFVVAQLTGDALGLAAVRVLYPALAEANVELVVPRQDVKHVQEVKA